MHIPPPHRPHHLPLILALLLCALLPAAQPQPAPAHPALRALAASAPEQPLRVIVQQRGPLAISAGELAARGATVTHDLSMINAFAAELPAGAALELARHPAVRWIAPDAPVESAACASCINTSTLISAYTQSSGARQLWNEAPRYLQGQGVTVAVIDSGIASHSDLGANNARVLQQVAIHNGSVNTSSSGDSATDLWGHGTHVAGIIGGNGRTSRGAQIGMAPKVNLVNVRVGDGSGMASTADVVAGLQWVYEKADDFKIRVVNLSINSTLPESYHTSALNAAVEIVWFSGVVVVVSGGNNGQRDSGVLYPPANDPFAISVGALDDRGTAWPGDDELAPFSAYGTTIDGISKPDIVAPGTNIVSLMARPSATLMQQHPSHVARGFSNASRYFRMSGTSMSAAVVSGAVALLLQDEPQLTPDQVKFRLMATARPLVSPGAGAGALDIYAAVKGSTLQSANQDLVISQILWGGSEPAVWTAANWGSANWGSANWGSANWGSANWGSANWGSTTWSSLDWGQ